MSSLVLPTHIHVHLKTGQLHCITGHPGVTMLPE